MSIEFHCTSCQQQIRVADAAEGKRGKCPHCGVAVQVPPAAAAMAGTAAVAKVSFACPSCQRTINAPASLAGKKGKCPHCNTVLIVGGGPIPAPGIQSLGNGLEPLSSSLGGSVVTPGLGLAPLADPLSSLGRTEDLFASLPAAPQPPSTTLPASNPLGYTPSASPLGVMSSSNPYASPALGGMGGEFDQYATRRQAPLKLKIPAIAMIIVAVLTIGVMLVTGINALSSPLPPHITNSPSGGTPYRLGQMTAFIVVILINVGVIGGAVQMLRLRGFDTARGGAVAACVPCSLACLNIIFGIWALIVIYQPDVRRLFR